ncbi:hypothetical protein B0H63DRAFT_175890 [Podospora didyma]|uniref:Uncharacterized protein n=1 Tax=Podospora didyma TaxID=330526 RepID=A0AAE0NNV8_9PEZI|nr:hypothetical protein B0H63DRAFT_175890 [Podospora didyma]
MWPAPNLKLSRGWSPPQTPTTTATSSPVLGRKGESRVFPPQHLHRPMPPGSSSQAMRPGHLSPRSSSSSMDSSSSDDDSDDYSAASPSRPITPERLKTPLPPLPPQQPQQQPARTGRTVTHAAFTVEEMSDFADGDEGGIQPDAIFEYAESDRSRSRSRNPPEIDQTIMYHLGNLNCSDESDLSDIDTAEYQDFLNKRREQRRHKRMTSGSIGKRTISESIGSDTDREDIKAAFLGAEEVGSSARRLRRRLDRRSLQFQDPPPPRIEEEDEEILITDTLARELPYYEYVSMQVDSP